MADVLKGLFGGAKSAVSSASGDVDDFADFATAAAASPLPPSHAASSASSAFSAASPTASASSNYLLNLISRTTPSTANRPYTKWYRVWERVEPGDFLQELIIIPILLITIAVNLWGQWANKSRAKQWAATHLPLLESEYASVGFSGAKTGSDSESGALKAGNMDVPDDLLREKTKNEYYTYATGRQNVAYTHVQLTLYKRYNPVTWGLELLFSFFFDSVTAPVERLEATTYAFDGREKAMVAKQDDGAKIQSKDSSYDGFVFAVVHKDKMQQLRDDRYDLSLTTTRDHAKLPDWATTMSESAEITEAMLTPELLKAVKETGEDLEALIITDQPIDAPKKLNDTIPNKRIGLSMKLNTRPSSTTLFQYFIRLPDFLASNAHFRNEAMRKIRQTRDGEASKIRKAEEVEQADERRSTSDKLKKEERERKLRSMNAEEQRKFLDREKKDETKKGMKKRTTRS